MTHCIHEGKDENINLAAKLMTSHIDVSSEQHCEDFITHSNEASCAMAGVSQEFYKQHFHEGNQRSAADKNKVT